MIFSGGKNMLYLFRVCICILCITFALGVNAQKIAKVSACYTFYAPENMTIESAKQTALNRAQIQAIAEEFGTIVSQTNSTIIRNSQNTSSVDFQSIGMSDVRGEWIETIGEPKYDISYENNVLVITVKTVGKIRELIGAKTDISVKILRNGTEDRFESTEFQNGDDLFVSFQSPVNGYLAVYLIDNTDMAYCLLPYRRQTEGIYNVEANKRYVFFSKDNAPLEEKKFVDEYVMTANSDEVNQIMLIFSPNHFTKVNDSESSSSVPRSCSLKDLNVWVANNRKFDKSIQILNNVIKLK